MALKRAAGIQRAQPLPDVPEPRQRVRYAPLFRVDGNIPRSCHGIALFLRDSAHGKLPVGGDDGYQTQGGPRDRGVGGGLGGRASGADHERRARAETRGLCRTDENAGKGGNGGRWA